ncbi:hypothetical protein D9V41_06205 [Aeromicrobium phragmitis]|uniref:Peptidase S1 domain-containing protein n=1 Tax=Aeromicrobium phragmitis TaxID=2478914 RepID=A0A3L8PN96_9ACTN|nr:hypothetical protein D9V41_06205 [Aeromicrobium phragmitis]
MDYDRDTNTVEVIVSPYAAQDKIDEIQALDERVVIRHAKHSKQEFTDIAHQLSGTKVGNATIWGSGPNLEHDGLIVYAEPDENALARGTQNLEDFETTVQGFEATVRLESKPIAAVGSHRFADYEEPHLGGAYMNRVNYGCTTGIPIGQPSTLRSIATAHHCAPHGTPYYAGQNQNVPIGSMVHTSRNNSDISRLYPATTWAPYVYVGPFNSALVAPIRGLQSVPYTTSNVCYSGAFTGTICGNTVEGIVNGLTVEVPGQGIQTYDNLILTRHSQGLAAAGQGDSGGPALINSGGNSLASGVISAIQPHNGAWDTCNGLGDRACSRLVLYSPMSNFLLGNPDWGVLYVP